MIVATLKALAGTVLSVWGVILLIDGTWGSGFKRSADRRMKGYSKGQRVLARVHPTEPALSVLQPGASEGVFLAFLLPAILMTLGVVWLLEGLSSWL